jgi:hypothetical protein
MTTERVLLHQCRRGSSLWSRVNPEVVANSRFSGRRRGGVSERRLAEKTDLEAYDPALAFCKAIGQPLITRLALGDELEPLTEPFTLRLYICSGEAGADLEDD